MQENVVIRALIIEDTSEKSAAFKQEISSYFAKTSVEIEITTSLQSAVKRIFEAKYDIIVTDLLMPRREGEEAVDVSDEIVSFIQDSARNSKTSVVAISQFFELVEERRKRFVEAGIILVHYDEGDGSGWRASLNVMLQRIEAKLSFDFVIVCALEKERNAFRSADCTVGEFSIISDLDCLHMSIGSLRGVCVKPPRMGLVDASIISARAIEVLSPSLICMAGICAGFSDEVGVGTLIVSDVCWEHQAGKWAGDTFKLEHYDIALENDVRSKLSQFIERRSPFEDHKRNLHHDAQVLGQPVALKPTVTGSAVIASEERIDEIKAQHRKLGGLDMEMYGLYRARELSISKPICFGAKTVVDLADSAKGDAFHTYGAVLSARFIVDAIKDILQPS
jgi:adenosylhomocysteine nucleosidase